MKIAVVDDEQMFTMQLKMMVNKLATKLELPFEVEAFSGGESFIETIKSTRFDIVFMDIFMPDMDGIETARRMRQLTERTFLIFTTASDEHYPDAFSLHAFDYVTKPFTIERIEKVLLEVLDHTPMDEAFIKVNVGSLDEKVYLHDIVTVLTDGHYLDIEKTDGDIIRVRMTSKEFMDAIGGDERFISVNRGVIINMDEIENVTDAEVEVRGGMVYSISSKKITAIIQTIKDYQFSKR